jgi:hypothetical protein
MNLSPDSLNADCACISLDVQALGRALEFEVGDTEFSRRLAETHPTLISSFPVFIRAEHATRMAQIIEAIEAIAKLPGYRQAALQSAPAAAQFEPGALGVFMGYDFHVGPEGPRLIEINTNAGGALINALVARAQKACCPAIERVFPGQIEGPDIGATFFESFQQEWRRQRCDAPLTAIAIVDTDPQVQYLYPEFVLFERLFRRHGIVSIIAAPQSLEYRDGKLWCGFQPIDLVYNRLTDFSLDEPAHGALRSAYLAGDVVLTPNPWSHAMFADKRNLVRLTDAETLERWGVEEKLSAIVRDGIPKTVLLSPGRADELWSMRNKLFFKPVGGFGGRAAYRGDKITRRVWQTILAGGYVAQDLVPPSGRTVIVDGRREVMKLDIRNYTYCGRVQLVAARLYQGQTTNFRTAGGGFAPVVWERSGCADFTSDAARCC